MYDELIAALRETDFGYVCEHCEHEDMCRNNDCVIIQAADAIEKLLTIISLYKKATGIEIDCDLVPLKEWEKKMQDGVL